MHLLPRLLSQIPFTIRSNAWHLLNCQQPNPSHHCFSNKLMVSNKEFVLPENAQEEPLRKALKKHKNSYFYLILSKGKRKVIKILYRIMGWQPPLPQIHTCKGHVSPEAVGASWRNGECTRWPYYAPQVTVCF